MQREVDATHCWEALVATLRAEQGWELSQEDLARYVAELRACLPASATVTEVRRTCGYYHQDHSLVTALRDQAHPEHSAAWDAWTRMALHVLYSVGLVPSSDAASDAHDLAQAALMELVRSLPKFRYQSQLSTWAHAVVVNTARRLHRDSRAKKRPQQCASLDQLPEFDQLLSAGDYPEAATNARMLYELIQTRLMTHGNDRLARIFFLQAVDDCATEQIGQIVQLHPSRVRALLAHARNILRDHPDLQTWAVG